MKLSRKYRILLMTIVCLVVLWFLYYAVISAVYGFKLRALHAQVNAEGSSLDLVQLGSGKALKANENAALLYRAAGLLMDMRTGPDIPEVASYNAFLMAEQTERSQVVTERRQSLEAWLRDSSMPLQLLHQAAGYEHASFELDYSAGGQIKLPHLAQLREGARLLMLEAWLAAQQGDSHKAMQAIWANLRIRDGIENEPILLSQLVGITTDSIGLYTLQDIMPAIRPTPADLRAILTELESRNPKAFLRGAEGERALIAGHISTAQKRGVRFVLTNEVTGVGCPTAFEAIVERALNARLPDATYSLSYMNRFVRTASQLDFLSWDDLDRSNNSEEQEIGRNVQSIGWRHFHELSSRLLAAFGPHLAEGKRDIARRAVAQCGVAAELYRLDHGSYPATLDALAPEYLTSVPLDTFTRKPLHFKSSRDGMLVYSVGLNGTDDAGDGRRTYLWGGDITQSPADDIAWRIERKPEATKEP